MFAAALALTLTVAQVNSLNLAYNYGAQYGISRTYMAVILVESSACMQTVGDDGKSLGCAQLQIYTARLICGCEISPGDLLHNQRRNLSIGAKFLAQCFANFWPDKRRSLYCYNVGIPKASKATNRQVEKSRYVRKVLAAERALESMRQNNE